MKGMVRRISPLAAFALALALLTGCGARKSDAVGRPEAENIALEDAGFPRRWVIELKSAPGRDGDSRVIDVSFINSTKRYKYVIDSGTGRILEKDASPLFGGE